MTLVHCEIPNSRIIALAAIEPETDYAQWAQFYDLFYQVGPDNEVDFYLGLMEQTEPPVLELGVGTGRIAIPAAEAGHEIVGIDMSESMLNVARSKMSSADVAPWSLELIQADMTDFNLSERTFGSVIIPGNSLALVLSERGQAATLAHAVRHLRRNGVLAFSLYNASEEVLDSDDDETFLLGVVNDEATGNRHIMTGINRFDRANQINRCKQFLETVSRDGETVSRHELPVTTRYLRIEQAVELADGAGLIVEEVYGDFDRTAYTATSDEMILVCRKP